MTSSIPWSVYSWRDLYQGLVQGMARGVLVLKSETVTHNTGIQTRALASISPSAASPALSRGSGVSGRLSEADPLVLLVCRSFLGVVNFCRLQAYTAGKCFSLSALVHDANQSASVLRVLFRPNHSAEPFGIPSILIPSLTGTRYQAGRPVHGGICKRERHAKCAKNLSLRCKEL